MPDTNLTQFQASALTPARATTVTFDIGELMPQEPSFALHREGEHLQPTAKSSVIKLSSGVMTLKPVNDIDVSRETSAAQGYVMRLADFVAAGVVTEVPRQRKYTELTGLSISGDVATNGDYFQRRRVTAGATWNNNLSGHTSPYSSLYGTPNYGIDRLAYATETHGPDTGYLLRLTVPGAYLQNPQFIFGFEFGGPVVGGSHAAHTGYGQFWLALMGDGTAILAEKIDGIWQEVNRWRYLSPRDIPQAEILMRILPHYPRFIEFTTLMHADPAAFGNIIGLGGETAYLAIKARQKDTSGGYGTFLHTVNNRGSLQNHSTGLLNITGPGSPAIDLRQDLSVMWQVSRLGYPASGGFTDRPFQLPYGVGNAHVVVAQSFGYNAINTTDGSPATSYAVVLEQADGSALTPNTETFTWNGTSVTLTGYDPPGGLNTLHAVFTLENLETAGFRYHTPSLVSYEVARRGHGGTVNGNEITGGFLQELHISGPGYEPENETAHLVIEDPTDALGFLRTRGLASLRVETTYDPADTSKKSILFEGYTGRVGAVRQGKAGMTYPAAAWRRLEIDCVGKWHRLQGRFFTDFQYFYKDDNAPVDPSTGGLQPWKVTDAIRKVLVDEGYSDAQLDIFDDDIRLFVPPNGSADNWAVPPGTYKTEFIHQVARDYLNAYFVWDANAGAAGMWRLLRPPVGTETPVWTFTTSSVASGKIAHLGASYGASTSPILGHPWEYRTYIVPPEGNCLTVTGPPIETANAENAYVQRQVINPTSWDSPTHSIADKNSIDYLGRIVPIEYVDHTLSGDDPESTQRIVDFIARRVFNLCCRGRKFFEFVSELVLIDAATLEPSIYTTRFRRPLRPGDTVTIDGERCIIHGCHPFFDKDGTQKQHVEAELFRFENTMGVLG